MPAVGFDWLTIPGTIIYDGDDLLFYMMRDPAGWWMDSIAWFADGDGYAVNTVYVDEGEEFDVTVYGYMPIYDDISSAGPIEDAQIVVLDVCDDAGFRYALFGEELGLTGEDGKLSISFSEPGTYFLSAYDGSGYGMPFTAPWLVVEVAVVKEPPIETTYLTAMNGALTYILYHASNPGVASIGGEWAVLARARACKSDAAWNAMYLANLRTAIAGAYSISGNKVILRKNVPTENERVILALTALGYDASDFEGYDFVTSLADTAWVLSQGVNSNIYSLLALNSKPYGCVDAGALVDALLGQRHADGGWGLAAASEVDLTAMAIQALAPYYGKDPGVTSAVDGALVWLDLQTIRDAEGNSQIIVALSALGLGVDAAAYADNLLAYYDADTGGFKRGASVNMMTTEQAAYALVAYDRLLNGKTALYDMSDLGSPVTPPDVSDAAAVAKAAADLTWDVIKGANPALNAVTGGLNLPVVGDGGVAIAWNSDSPVYVTNTGAVTRPDYAAGDKTVRLTATLTKGTQSKTATFIIIVKAYGPPSETKSYARISVTDPGATGSQTSVYFARKQYELIEGDTAYSLLLRTGLNIKTANFSEFAGVYIESINGFGEFSDGPLSGWMYRVNGTFPDYSSSLYILGDGDLVEWIYTRDLGKDIGGGNVTGNTGATPGPSSGADKSTASGDGSGGGSAPAVITDAPASGGPTAGILDSEIPLGAIKDWINPFIDVKEGDWFYEAVKFMNALSLMVGTDDDVFSPDMNLSRAMVVTILWRMEGKPAPDGNGTFTDVPAGQWYTEAIAWAHAEGIVAGYGNGLFGPDDDVTREQFAVILYNYAKYKELDTEAEMFAYEYSDVDDISGWAWDAMKWANANGLILGRSARELAPSGTATRAEVALMLERFITKFN